MSAFIRPKPIFKKGPEAYNPVAAQENIELRDIELDYPSNRRQQNLDPANFNPMLYSSTQGVISERQSLPPLFQQQQMNNRFSLNPNNKYTSQGQPPPQYAVPNNYFSNPSSKNNPFEEEKLLQQKLKKLKREVKHVSKLSQQQHPLNTAFDPYDENDALLDPNDVSAMKEPAVVYNGNDDEPAKKALFVGADYSDPRNLNDPNFDHRVYEDYLTTHTIFI